MGVLKGQRINSGGKGIRTRGRSYNSNDILRLFGKIKQAAKNGAWKGYQEGVEQIATDMLKREVLRARQNPSGRTWNDYTGNLERSYSATIVSQGKTIRRIYYESKLKANNIYPGPKGGKYAFIQKPLHHKPPAAFKFKSRKTGKKYKPGPKYLLKNGEYIRYLNKMEKRMLAGSDYRNRASQAKIGSWRGGAAGWGTFEENDIIIENTAPYADYVRRRGFRVLQSATVRQYKDKMKKFVRIATVQELKKAGFDIR